ncbi:hypothetical protein PPL_02362 [Heterostelium album PN500]|uniref:Uncharacterized protein n=1 Tax=Heterostelium pallidum (strain ATCC 26659 / Pp 5 / PN500) TaxID=670386 RepID=D3B235_HETP5|nr:hypothetical protein PPL_02362 [Heterostelium album PN500]EFA85359.1 hypothetical protein PPL_02362 [Heterostelium album PN500]|eukprot:XP_020437468.1 hypothetical protein PPL_02362 [Heterostelium album PN500]
MQSSLSTLNISKLISTGLPSLLLASSALYIGYSLYQRKQTDDNLKKNIYIEPIIDSLLDHFKQQQQQQQQPIDNNNTIDIILIHDNEIDNELIDEIAQKLYKSFTASGSNVYREWLNRMNKTVSVFSITKEEFVHYNQYNANRTSITAIVNIESSYPTSITTQLSLCSKSAKLLLLNHPFITIFNHKISTSDNKNTSTTNNNTDIELPLNTSEIQTIYNLSGFSNVKITQFVNGHPMTLLTSTSPNWKVGVSDTIKLS